MSELKEIIYILGKIHLSEKTIRRWIYRTEIYGHAQKAIDKGIEVVDTQYFDKHEIYLRNNFKLNGTR